MWQDFGPLGENHAIQIQDAKACRRHAIGRRPQHLGRITPFVGWIGVWKQFPDVPKRGRPEECVGDRVQEHIGIAVPQGLFVVRNRNTAQHEAGAGAEPVGVVPEADADRRVRGHC